MKTKSIQVFLVLCCLALSLSCEKEEQFIRSEESIKTVSLDQALDIMKQTQQDILAKSNANFITSISEEVNYEDLTNTDEELAVIPVTTQYSKLNSRLVLLTIDGKVQSAVVSLKPFEDSTPSSFSGELLITDKEGNIRRALVFDKNSIVADYKHNTSAHKSQKNDTGKTIDAKNCWCGLSNCDWCGELDEVVIKNPTPYVSITQLYPFEGTADSYMNEWNSGGSGSGYIDNSPEPEADPEEDKPCPGDPLINPELVSSGASGKKGGTFGCTRQGGTDCSPPFDKKHDGMDIKAELDSNAYAMYSGTVSGIRDSFAPRQYLKDSYGNYVMITIQHNGNTFFIKYNHLNTVNVERGQVVNAGDIIGTTGNTGNAASRGVIPHIHLQVFNASWESIDPSDFLNTKFDNNFNPISNCN